MKRVDQEQTNIAAKGIRTDPIRMGKACAEMEMIRHAGELYRLEMELMGCD